MGRGEHHKPSRESWGVCSFVSSLSQLGSWAPRAGCTRCPSGGVLPSVPCGAVLSQLACISFADVFILSRTSPHASQPGPWLHSSLCKQCSLHRACGVPRVLSLKIMIRSAITLFSLLFWTDQKLRILADPRTRHVRASHVFRTLKMMGGGGWASGGLRSLFCYARITNI